MLTYQDLSPAQKKYVDLLQSVFPDVYKRGSITYKELNEIHDYFVEQRAVHKGFKCAKPLWLITYNAIDRGTYKIPKKGARSSTKAEVLDEFEVLYRAELEACGIKPKPKKK